MISNVIRLLLSINPFLNLFDIILNLYEVEKGRYDNMNPNSFGVRIAFLDERSYRYQLWTHEPLTDFWRVGKGTQERLLRHGIKTMGDIALCSKQNEELLYRIYSHNCDTVARELLEMVDQDVRIFDGTNHYRTPLANIKAFSREMDEWSAITIGEQTLKEKMYTFFMIF